MQSPGVGTRQKYFSQIFAEKIRRFTQIIFLNLVSANICVKILRSSARNSLQKILSCTEKPLLRVRFPKLCILYKSKELPQRLPLREVCFARRASKVSKFYNSFNFFLESLRFRGEYFLISHAQQQEFFNGLYT